MYGKWHLGDCQGRLPTDQGFDEWWGYRNTADECGYTSYAAFNLVAKEAGLEAPQICEGKKGGTQGRGPSLRHESPALFRRIDRGQGHRLHQA
jgi:hypothetical protein